MKVIIAGSRSITDDDDVDFILNELRADWLPFDQVVSGLAPGVDTIGKDWAEIWDIPVKEFPADWDQYGKSAGFRRNEQMAEYADVLVAIWDGESPGTKDMIQRALDHNLRLFVYTIKENPQ